MNASLYMLKKLHCGMMHKMILMYMIYNDFYVFRFLHKNFYRKIFIERFLKKDTCICYLDLILNLASHANIFEAV